MTIWKFLQSIAQTFPNQSTIILRSPITLRHQVTIVLQNQKVSQIPLRNTTYFSHRPQVPKRHKKQNRFTHPNPFDAHETDYNISKYLQRPVYDVALSCKY